MSFSDVRLPNQLIVDLYKSKLVDLPNKAQNSKAPDISETLPAESQAFLGGNAKQVMIMVNYASAPFLPAKQLDFLTNILKACGLNMDDIAIVNAAKLSKGIEDVMNRLSPATIILFGQHALAIAENTEFIPFALTQIKGISLVSAPPLENLNQDSPEGKLLKRKLWESLRLLFKL